jgi:hypothetical protein
MGASVERAMRNRRTQLIAMEHGNTAHTLAGSRVNSAREGGCPSGGRGRPSTTPSCSAVAPSSTGPTGRNREAKSASTNTTSSHSTTSWSCSNRASSCSTVVVLFESSVVVFDHVVILFDRAWSCSTTSWSCSNRAWSYKTRACSYLQRHREPRTAHIHAQKTVIVGRFRSTELTRKGRSPDHARA